jgi:hypothetical protein
MPTESLKLPGLKIEPLVVEFPLTIYDLFLEMTEMDQRLVSTIRYNTDLF